MKIKKMMATIMSVAMLGTCGLSSVLVAGATDCMDSTGYGRGAAVVTEDEMNAFYSQFDSSDSTANSIMPYSVSTACDLSSSSHPDNIYFPPIGNQGGIGSCTAWATTYYQYTYAANKLNETATTSSNAYSPSWTYNYINHGEDKGSGWSDAYNILMHQGALTLAEMPYNTNNYSLAWSSDTDAMMNALKTRLSEAGDVSVSGTGTAITSKADSDLDDVKTLISTGHVLLINVEDMQWSYKNRYNNSSEKVVYRAAAASDDASGHAMVVVGYNDNVYCDVNRNGIIEESEKGAFKIANSWGTGWGNNGYMWVLYDALNGVSANKTNNWESSESGTRVPIFKFYSTDNYFHYIEVSNYDVNMAGLLTVNTNYRNKLSVGLFRNTTGAINTATTENYFDRNGTTMSYREKKIGFNGSIVVDFGKLDDPVSVVTNGYYYGVNINNLYGGNSYDNTEMRNVTFKIIDDKFNIIKDFRDLLNMPTIIQNGSNSKYCTQIKFDKGDLNYDGRVSPNDANIVMNYVADIISLSTLQMYLADFNGDGYVNVSDIVAINKYINSSTTSASELEEIQAINEKAVQFMKNSGYSQSEIEEAEEINAEIQQQIKIVETNLETE